MPKWFLLAQHADYDRHNRLHYCVFAGIRVRMGGRRAVMVFIPSRFYP